MRIKHKKLVQTVMAVVLVASFASLYTAGHVSQTIGLRPAVVYADGDDGGTADAVPEKLADTRKNDCHGDLNASNCGIVKILQMTINILSAVAGLAIVIAIIVAGIQYTASQDDPQALASAKGRITNALIALVLLIFFGGLLQWLVPGAVL